MNKFLLPLALALAASTALAQNCLDPNRGTLLSTNPADILLPIQSMGMTFPIAGVTYTDIHITDHGYVQFSNGGIPAPMGGGVLYTPTTANFLAGSAKVCALYADIVGSGGGQIFFKTCPAGTPAGQRSCVVSWINMQNFGTPLPRFDFQMRLCDNGEVRIVFGANVTNVSTFGVPSDNGICGITPGGGGLLPPNSNLWVANQTVGTSAPTFDTTNELWTVPLSFDIASNSVHFIPVNPGTIPAGGGYLWITTTDTNCATATTTGVGCLGMSLAPTNLPILGSCDFCLTLTGVGLPPLTLMAFGSGCLPSPGIPLGGGCFLCTNADIGAFGLTGPGTQYCLTIPKTPSLAGASLCAQGVELQLPPLTPFLKTSNCVQFGVGY